MTDATTEQGAPSVPLRHPAGEGRERPDRTTTQTGGEPTGAEQPDRTTTRAGEEPTGKEPTGKERQSAAEASPRSGLAPGPRPGLARASRPARNPGYLLIVSCPDRPGLVYAVSSFLVQHSGNILSSQQYDDLAQDRFFMRVHFEITDSRVDLERLRAGFVHVAASFRMTWRLVSDATPTRTLILVSRFGHCLNDLLFRTRSGGLNIEVPAVVSNHRDFEPLATTYGVPFHHLPVTPQTKPAAEARLLALVEELQIDLVVLARYMQVLSGEVCQRLQGRAINIHHSFLPSFQGAKPYHQAHQRGVKLIGATAHYVTADLDAGPIIEQDVTRVDHSFDPDQLVAAGWDVEASVLARAVRWHSEHRVLLNGHRTVVFR
jgi:formyltetrahydrofolate deformylase